MSIENPEMLGAGEEMRTVARPQQPKMPPSTKHSLSMMTVFTGSSAARSRSIWLSRIGSIWSSPESLRRRPMPLFEKSPSATESDAWTTIRWRETTFQSAYRNTNAMMGLVISAALSGTSVDQVPSAGFTAVGTPLIRTT
jgi:hypothetical protein